MSHMLTLVLYINYIFLFNLHTLLFSRWEEVKAQREKVSSGAVRSPGQAGLTLTPVVLTPHWAASRLTHPTACGNVTFALQIFFYIDIYSCPHSPVSLSLSLSLCLCVSVSLSHTQTHNLP